MRIADAAHSAAGVQVERDVEARKVKLKAKATRRARAVRKVAARAAREAEAEAAAKAAAERAEAEARRHAENVLRQKLCVARHTPHASELVFVGRKCVPLSFPFLESD